MHRLYRPEYEHDGCGFGLMAHLEGEASHALVHRAIGALDRLTHRGAVAADGKSGDGCGLLMGLPKDFLREAAVRAGIALGGRFAVGMVFLNPAPQEAAEGRRVLAQKLSQKGLHALGWREVPTDPDVLGPRALASLPRIEQVFVEGPAKMAEAELERRLFVARRLAHKALQGQDPVFHVATLSSRLLAYKGLVLPHHLARFYPDLADPRLAASVCVFHQRFSTNTWPEWRLAQPFRFLAHNGELNTIQGNRNWVEARAHTFRTPLLPDLEEISPWVSRSGSDSFSLDNMLEVLVMGGMDLFKAIRLLIPPAWQNAEGMDPAIRAFYEYHGMHQESWDGPAGIVLTDGRHAACLMDRNGLRPARYVITRDRHITLASEVGVYDYAPEEVVAKGRLGPGEMIAVDLAAGSILYPKDIEHRLAAERPYKAWLEAHARRIETRIDEDQVCTGLLDGQRLETLERLFLLTREEREQVLRPLATTASEPVGSMGDDTPLPVLSTKVRSLYDSFRQQFAQVTNPAIDPLREHLVMSLQTSFGQVLNLFAETPEHAARLVVDSPILSTTKFAQLTSQRDRRYACSRLALAQGPQETLRGTLERLQGEAVQAVRKGSTLLVLSDHDLQAGDTPVHALLATGAVHHRLIAAGLRCKANILVETGTARDAHQMAVLIGFGATAIHPYLAYALLCRMQGTGELGELTAAQALGQYRQGLNKGLLKILSKMGISTVASYRGAQLFEAFGIDQEVVDLCFTGTITRIQGMGFGDIEADQRRLARNAWRGTTLPHGGLFKYVHGEEYHAFNPEVVKALHRTVRSPDEASYAAYQEAVNGRPPMVLRDLLGLKEAPEPLPIEEVEPIESILPRFETGAMSLGAISPEAHETLAEAMHRLGGRSNSGEGGEDPARYGTPRNSAVKQVASGRFGVTPHYLVNAEVLQIKIAQGAKPGEGGQLAGGKVNALIARLRHTLPGTPLISPPPHHDIYSIEDLAQLIFDLKQVNPQALVSVKLVSEPGVGTIAAGVAKAYADLITLSGYDGGTGASPLSSVHYAGAPWELGLKETQDTLRANDLRDKVRLQVDGGLKTGLDVVKAALLGAESFGFGTAALVAMGCKYLRICHLNNCATGVATQHQALRGHFRGEVDQVISFFLGIAEEVRYWLSHLGAPDLDSIIGHPDLLRPLPGRTERQRHLDLSPLLGDGGVDERKPRLCSRPGNPSFDRGELAERMVRDAKDALVNGGDCTLSYRVRNSDRSIGARLSGELARRFGAAGPPDGRIRVRLRGTAGQGLGAWNAAGLHLYLEGDANDYVGKGMAGGRIVLHPPPQSPFDWHEAVILGNTCLYGATGGTLFAAGRAGERFAVRNSGARAVVEGAGDHCCEYMTGGVVVVLGPCGHNFGAGMTGGVAFVLDPEHEFSDLYNHELVDIQRIDGEAMDAWAAYLYALIQEFVAETQSPWGQRILREFRDWLGRFWLVKPIATDLEALRETLDRAT